jgi:hypothetical protein
MELKLNNFSTQNNLKGRFLKGRIPHNKGKKWNEWMDGRKQRKVLRCLNHKGNPNLAGANARKIIGIKDNKFCFFESSEDAGRKLGITARNIRSCCHKKRKTCGGFYWFFEDSNEWIEFLKSKNE